MSMPHNDLEHGFLLANGVRLHYAQSGKGKLVLFLHGFPQCWYAWRRVLPEVGRSFRAVGVDMRGYNESDKPIRVREYSMDCLVKDAAQAIRALGSYRATIVGHDWGGAVAWELASRHPALVDRLVLINSPHPAVMRDHLRKNIRQLARSWYMLFFQLPFLPELVLGRGGFSFLERALRPLGSPHFIGPADLAFYRKALSRPGALSAALNYYRAAFRGSLGTARPYPVIQHPTLMLWGEKDELLGRELAEGSRRYARNLELRFHPASHWLPEEAPELVASSILDFLGAPVGAVAARGS